MSLGLALLAPARHARSVVPGGVSLWSWQGPQRALLVASDGRFELNRDRLAKVVHRGGRPINRCDANATFFAVDVVLSPDGKEALGARGTRCRGTADEGDL